MVKNEMSIEGSENLRHVPENVEGYMHVQTVCMPRAMHTLRKELRRPQGLTAG